MLPNHFLTASPLNAQFDYFDIANGVGYQRLYPCAYTDSVGNKYCLVTKDIDGDVDLRSLNVTNSNSEVNFDITFKKPAILFGEALVNYTYGITGNCTVTTAFKLYHVDLAATETQIGAVTSSAKAETPGAAAYKRRFQKMDLTTKSFAIGEKLRLEIIFTIAGAQTGSLYFDPGSRSIVAETGTSANIGTDMTLDVGFKIDL